MSQRHSVQDGSNVVAVDERGNVLIAIGGTPPADGLIGYAKGGLFIDTDGGGSDTNVFVNQGTDSSSNFDEIINAGVALPLSGGTLSGNLTLGDNNIVAGTTTGIKIGTATSQKLGFFNATPVDQEAAIADVGTANAANNKTAILAILAALRALGLIAT